MINSISGHDNGWKTYKLKDCILQLNTGLNPRDNFTLGCGDIKYITAKNLTREGYIDFSGCDYVDLRAKDIIHRRSDIQRGDILFSSRAPIGNCHYIKENPDYYEIGESIFCIRVNKDIILPEYLCLYFTSDYFIKSASKRVTGSVIKEIRISDLLSMEIIVPEQSIQKQIADCIGNIDEKIEMNTSISNDLETIAKLFYDYWFVQFDFPDEDGKPYKSSGGKMIWNEHLKRRIPEDWTVERLGNYCNFENGDRSNNYPSGDDFIPIGIPFIAGGAIKDNGINYTELRYISEEKFCSLRAGKANYGDILMTLRGSLAKYVLSPFEKLAIASALVIVRPKGIVTNEYLYSVLTSDYYNRLMSNYNNGSVQANLSVDVVRTFPIIIPDKAIMDRFSKVQCELIKMKILLDIENRQLTTIRDFLLPMLLNEQVKVKETENTLSEM